MAKYKLGLLLVLLLAFTACERPAPPATADATGSYNLTLYLQEQKARMQAKKPMVLKSVTTEGQPTETVETDDIDWQDELSVFEQLDLRRPALEEYYLKQEKVLENGDIAVEYKKREDSEPIVHYLFLTLSPDRKLKHLAATLQDKNPLFYSYRRVYLEAEPATGNISSYSIEGVQKLIFNDSLHYAVKANL
ncbi:hypothetical protein [uncultured Pontibacter sp.]|uniref:hypothetical protein n=1 Tax=uncultured Pontibacter sp. TaxID=453356 RepID=UPI002613BC77|nr:hypothetical protein [uncultured Pontibacter sp.]